MKTKITYDQARYILNWKKPHRFAKYCGVWTVEPKEVGYVIRCDVKWWVYIILVVPATIIEAVLLMWDGGLRYCRPVERNVYSDHLFPPLSIGYDRLVEILGERRD